MLVEPSPRPRIEAAPQLAAAGDRTPRRALVGIGRDCLNDRFLAHALDVAHMRDEHRAELGVVVLREVLESEEVLRSLKHQQRPLVEVRAVVAVEVEPQRVKAGRRQGDDAPDRALVAPTDDELGELVERPRVSYTGEFDTFDREELERLSAVAESPQDAALYLTAAFTGLRTGELFALRWEHVDFVGGLLHVRRSFDYKRGVENVPKGWRVRSVPMMPEVLDLLGQLKEREHFTGDSDLVFCSEVGEHLDYYAHLRRYKESLKGAELREVRFHDLRHAFGSAAITTLDPYAVQSYMGHQHYSTTQRYLHHKPGREDAARLAEAFKAGHGASEPEPAKAPSAE